MSNYYKYSDNEIKLLSHFCEGFDKISEFCNPLHMYSTAGMRAFVHPEKYEKHYIHALHVACIHIENMNRSSEQFEKDLETFLNYED